MSNTAVADFQQVDRPDLYQRDGASFYRITPVKGARIDGVVSVGVSSDEVGASGAQHWEPKRTVPAMWIDYTPHQADNNGHRELITVNGRQYGEGFGGAVSGRVEFMPADSYSHLAEYYPAMTVGGEKYFVRGTVSQFDHVTDKAREVLGAVAAAIAAVFVTDERWHAHQVLQAKHRVARAMTDRDKAQETLDAAAAELEALTS